MTMKKKIITTLSVVLILGMASLGILAYLTSEDSDVNVMTLGNVQIDQIEQQWEYDQDGNKKLVDFEGNETGETPKPLYPYVGEIAWSDKDADNNGAYRTFAMNNVVDKYVTVKNTGKSDAYVRTFIALEKGTATDAQFDLVGISINSADGEEFKNMHWMWEEIGEKEIEGNTYYVMAATYDEILKPTVETIPSLLQVYLSKDADNDTVKALDGNKNGTYDILVYSEAVQAKGFADAKTALETAFGVPLDGYIPWGTVEWPGYFYDGKDIHASTTMSGTFALGADIKTSDYGDDARYGYGYEYIVRNKADYTLDLNGKTILHDTVNENANHNAFTYTFVANHAGTKLTINGDGKVHSNNSAGYTCAVQGKDGTLITINGGDFEVDNGIAVWAGAGSHIVINGGSYVNGNATTDHELIYSSGGVIDIYGGFFHNTEGDYTLNVEDRNRVTGFINVYGGTYVNFDPSTGGQDPNNIKVADGYKVVSETQANGDVWYTVVPE